MTGVWSPYPPRTGPIYSKSSMIVSTPVPRSPAAHRAAAAGSQATVMKIIGGYPQLSGPPTTEKPSLPATHREHLGRIGGSRRRLLRGVHDDVESVITLAGIRTSKRTTPSRRG